MTFTVQVGYIALPGAITLIVPSEEDIAFDLFCADEKKKLSDTLEHGKLVADAKAKTQIREKYLDRAQYKDFVLTKPDHKSVKMAQVKYSKGDPITGRTTVNQIGVMMELFPASISEVPEDTTIAEYLENKLFNVLYPTREQIDFFVECLAEFYSVVTNEQRRQISLPPEAEIFRYWRLGFGLPSPDGTIWSMPNDMAEVLLRLQNAFPFGD